jgi:hypothetical protein
MQEGKKYEVRFYHRGISIGGAIVSKKALDQGYLETMFFEYLEYPWLYNKIVNAQVKLIKINYIDLDFQNSNNILLEV